MPIDISEINPKTIFNEENVLGLLKATSPLGYSPTELAKLYKRDRSTVSELVNKLKRKGLLKSLKDGKYNYFYYNTDLMVKKE